ncbi:hypothetical protein [Blastococcus mobilis]|uniref:Uncharacterized protein n=1 Tax=Blastococcus mobilis TaxID=1938746 RepID=A0A238YMK9_9ACTN|nr:hypothetical protein [Blastococcus mobilis]SNR72028.1 hypothetical protein SAMN06272737_12121 [Blastococcus mobilis]
MSLLEDLLAVELLLANDILARASTRPALGAGTGAVLDMVQSAIAAADPYPDAVHGVLRTRFPSPNGRTGGVHRPHGSPGR